ncbi:MAG: hypothetical protein V4739_17605 [Pseudomonadota bacterium]
MTVENCLLVTVQSNLTHLPWGLIVDSGADAMEVCKRRQFGAVFSDYGALHDRSNGLRLARALRAQARTLHIYLLSDRPDLSQIQSALHAGATDLLLRDMSALQRVLALLQGEVRHAQEEGWADSELAAAAASGIEIKRLEQLLSDAGLGPAAEMAVNDAITQLTQTEAHAIDLVTIAQKVSVHIPDPADREEFLSQFVDIHS